jgi:hypothetical protein
MWVYAGLSRADFPHIQDTKEIGPEGDWYWLIRCRKNSDRGVKCYSSIRVAGPRLIDRLRSGLRIEGGTFQRPQHLLSGQEPSFGRGESTSILRNHQHKRGSFARSVDVLLVHRFSPKGSTCHFASF